MDLSISDLFRHLKNSSTLCVLSRSRIKKEWQQRLKTSKKKTRKTLCFRFSRTSTIFLRIIISCHNNLHLNITTFEPNLARYEDINANAIASQWAGIEGCDFLEKRKYAACFIGRMYGQRAGLIKKLKKEFGNKIFIHDTRYKPISEELMLCAYQNSWLAIDEPTAYDGKTRQIKARLFENASMGCLVVTKPNDRIKQYFQLNREILFWETISELIDIIRDCADNPEKYKKMARLAYERTQREHLYEHRFREVFKQCWR